MLPATVALASLASMAVAQSCPAGSLPANQVLRWTPCPVDTTVDETQYYAPDLECATIDVPLDYTNAKSEGLVIPLVRVPATNPSNRTIIYNPGGPGASGIESLIQGGSDLVSLAGGSYHILSFDPRGVGLTNPYTCPYPDETAAGWYLPLDDPDGLNATYTNSALQGDACAQSPYLEAGELVGTAFTARDINAIAGALQEDGMIRYWGYSYGTLLGSTLGAMFPDKIDRMVLDGNINPTDYYHGPGDEACDDVDRELDYFFSSCAAAGPANSDFSEGCAWADQGSTAASLKFEFYDFLDGLENGTYTIQDRSGDYIYYTTVKNELFGYMYSASYFPTMAASLRAYWDAATVTRSSKLVKKQSDFDVTAQLGGSWPRALDAITCGEWDEIPAGDLNDFKELLAIYNERSRFGADQLIGIVFTCATWNISAKEAFTGKFEGIQTNTPVLFVNSDRDPVTPLVSAQNSSSGFIDSAVIRHTGAGHCSSAHPSNCVQEKVLSYWQTGEIPDVTEICQPNVQAFMGDVSTPFNNTRPIGNDTESRTGEDIDRVRFNQAVANLANHVHGKRDVPKGFFEFPAELLRRDVTPVASRTLQERQDDSASCTSMSAVPSSTRTSGGSSSSSSSSSGEGNGVGRVAVSGGLALGSLGLLAMLVV